MGTFNLVSAGRQTSERYAFWGQSHITIDSSLRVTVHRGTPLDYARTTDYTAPGMDSGRVTWEPVDTVASLENKALFTQGFYHEMRYFCDCILKGRAAEIGSLEFALSVMRVYEAALLSEGNRVTVETGNAPPQRK